MDSKKYYNDYLNIDYPENAIACFINIPPTLIDNSRKLGFRISLSKKDYGKTDIYTCNFFCTTLTTQKIANALRSNIG